MKDLRRGITDPQPVTVREYVSRAARHYWWDGD